MQTSMPVSVFNGSYAGGVGIYILFGASRDLPKNSTLPKLKK